MVWETRNGHGRYYTRRKRLGRCVVSEYIGTGLIGELAAQQDAQRRAEQETQRQAFQADHEQWVALEQPVAELDIACTRLMHQALEQAGYHQHHHGEWRKRRGHR